MLTVVMLSVVMLSVVAPLKGIKGIVKACVLHIFIKFSNLLLFKLVNLQPIYTFLQTFVKFTYCVVFWQVLNCLKSFKLPFIVT